MAISALLLNLAKDAQRSRELALRLKQRSNFERQNIVHRSSWGKFEVAVGCTPGLRVHGTVGSRRAPLSVRSISSIELEWTRPGSNAGPGGSAERLAGDNCHRQYRKPPTAGGTGPRRRACHPGNFYSAATWLLPAAFCQRKVEPERQHEERLLRRDNTPAAPKMLLNVVGLILVEYLRANMFSTFLIFIHFQHFPLLFCIYLQC